MRAQIHMLGAPYLDSRVTISSLPPVGFHFDDVGRNVISLLSILRCCGLYIGDILCIVSAPVFVSRAIPFKYGINVERLVLRGMPARPFSAWTQIELLFVRDIIVVPRH